MNKPRIFFLDPGTVDLGDISLGALKKQGRYQGMFRGTRANIIRKAREADIVISNKFYLGKTEMTRLPRLKLICIAATGTNNVDLEAARRRGIAVCNVAGYSTATVVEHALMFLLAWGHRLLEHSGAVQRGAWSRSPHFALLDYPYSDLEGKTLGILGYGTIGRRVARVARALGMKVLIGALPGRRYTKKNGRVSLKSLLKQSDFVSLHCALGPITQGLMNRNTLAWMKPAAYLLNLARGPVVDEAAVAHALLKGKVAGYAADVMVREPPDRKNPLLDPALRDKVLITPHIAWASRESRQRLVDEIGANIAAFKRGRRRNQL